MEYEATRSRVEHYFDRTATKVWDQLTSDAPVSRIRQTVRRGRDAMRARMLERLPADLTGARVLDAGCGTGLMATELAARGARVTAVDISPSLIEIAQRRLPDTLRARVQFQVGDMLSKDLGQFDHVMAMDSLIYYREDDIQAALDGLAQRTHGNIVFTVPPRTPLLMAMWHTGKLFPRSDRSPVMVPHGTRRLASRLRQTGTVEDIGRVSVGFYISHALEVRP